MSDNPTWPTGCHDPASCERHRRCMYLGCGHVTKVDIGPEIDAAIAAKTNQEIDTSMAGLINFAHELGLDPEIAAARKEAAGRTAIETLATIRRILATVPYPLGPYGALGEIDRALGRAERG